MKSIAPFSITLLSLSAVINSQAAELSINDISLTPDGTTATEVLQTDIATLNGSNVLPNNTVNDVYTITTYNFGTDSDAHFVSRFNATGGQNRLGIEVNNDGLFQFVSSGDGTRTNFNLATDMAGTSVTVIMKQNFDSDNNLTYGYVNSGQDTLMNVWVSPTFSSVEGSGLSAGDMFTLWNSNTYGFYTHTIQNQSTPGTAGDSSISDTIILTGADASFPRALEYALEGGPTAPGVVSAYISTVSASPILVPNDNATASTITVTLTDSAGDPVAGKEVSLASDGDALITPASDTSDINGQVTFAVTSGTSSVQEFTATNVTDSNMVLYQKTSVTFEPVGTIDPDTSTVEVSLADVPADGSTTSTVTVTLRNSLGDPVSGKDVTLTGDTGDADISPIGTETTDVNGEATFTVSSNVVGTEIFTATDVTGTPPPASIPITQTVQVVFTDASPTPALLFHEPFDYAAGSDLNGQGGWTSGSNTGGAFAEVHDGTGSESWDGAFTGVNQSGNYVGESKTPNADADHVYGGTALDPSVTATFTDGTVTWLSFIGYNNTQVAIGADVLNSRGENADGQNIGAGGIFNNNSVRAHYWDDEDMNGSFEGITSLTLLGNSNPQFVIAKIVWSDTGEDTITCARFSSGSTITEAEFNIASQSTISADLDQSTFDTISFAGSNQYVDEIRVATTFDEAVTGTLGSGSDYDTWAGGYPGLGLPGDDDDGDGLTNDEERIFGLDPTSGASVDPYSTPLNSSTGTFSYTRRTQSLTSLTYKIYYSTDLENWFEDTVGTPSQSAGAPVGDVEVVDVTLDATLLTEAKLFIQVRAE